MPLSRGSVGALTAGVLIALALSPEPQPFRGPEQLAAQETPKTKTPPAGTSGSGQTGSKLGGSSEAGQTPQPPIVPEPAPVDHPLSSDLVYHSKNEARVAAALKTQVDFQIKPQPFQDALKFIASHYQIPILIDHRAFEDANIDATQEVALSASGITLQDTLHWLFSQMPSPIESEIRNGALWISTLDKIYEDQTIIVYDCRDLIPPETQEPADESSSSTGGAGFFQVATAAVQEPGAAAPVSPPNASPAWTRLAVARRAAKLISALKAATPPEEWEGDSNIRPLVHFQGMIIARQDPFTQKRIRRLLAEIRWMRTQGAFAPSGDPSSRATSSSEQATATPPGPEQAVVDNKPGRAKANRTRTLRKESNARRTPDNHAGTPRPPVILEDNRVHSPLRSDLPERSPNETRIAAALDAPVDFHIPPQSFKAALDFIASHDHIPIVIDYRALADANFDLDTKVDANIPGITLDDLLHWLVAQLNWPLEYEVCNGALFISTVEKLNEDLSMVVYDCRDLLSPVGLASAAASEPKPGKDDQVKPQNGRTVWQDAMTEQGHPAVANNRFVRRVSQIQAIIESLDFQSYDAHISDFDGLLVIRMNRLDQERIKRVLASIRWMKTNGAFAGLADQFVAPPVKAATAPK